MLDTTVTADEFILNGTVRGSSAQRLKAAGWNPNALRPWLGQDGHSYVTRTENGKSKALLSNTAATLTIRQWQYLDARLQEAVRQEITVWPDLMAAVPALNVPGGIGKTVIQTQTMTDAHSARLAMSPLAMVDRDRPETDVVNLPLPIVQSNYSYDLRELETSKGSGMELDATSGEMCARRCAEVLEQLLLGTYGTYTWGGGTLYGYTNHPDRITKVLTLPTAGGWTPETFYAEITDMCQSLADTKYGGPYKLYISRGWIQYLSRDYLPTYAKSLRARILEDGLITSIASVDYMTNFSVVVVQLTSKVVQPVVALPMTTMEWEGSGGLEQFAKIMGCMVPRFFINSEGNTGVAHGVAA